MINLKEEKIQIEKEGNTVDCDILFTFDSEDTARSYVGYTDHSIGDNGRKNVYVSSYNPFGTKLELEDITDQKELEMINQVLTALDEEN